MTTSTSTSDQLVGYVEVLRGLSGGKHVRTGTPATAEQLTGIERELGVTLPDDYKKLIGAVGYVCAGETADLVVFGIAPADHGCPHEVDVRRAAARLRDATNGIPLLRLVVEGEEQLHVLDEHGALRLFRPQTKTLEPSPDVSFYACAHAVMQAATEARLEALAEAADAALDDDELEPGQAHLQMHSVPKPVVAALKKEPGVADEITIYTSVAEFREQTVAWEKTQRDTDPPEQKELVRRMRSLLHQRDIGKLDDLVGPAIEVFRWPDALIACLGEQATESLALRGTTQLPTDGTDTIHMLSIAEVKQVAAALDGSEDRLRAGYRPDELRARGLYNTDAPNDAAFLEELAAIWDYVVEGIKDAAAEGRGWIIRRTEG